MTAAIVQELTSLVRRFPLPAGARLEEPFTEAADINGVIVHTVGLAAEFRGECITGSAGSLASAPLVRAYMELVERLSITSLTEVEAPDVSADGAALSWRASRSNGVAIGVTFEDAARRARLELIERDRVLRSWYGGPSPEPVEIAGLLPPALLEVYSFEACLFEGVHGAHTAGVFGFPRGDAPLIHGFAAREDRESAISSAMDECLQRLGFLWGEAIPTGSPEPEPTPGFHQEHYLCPQNHGALREWVRGRDSDREIRAFGEPPREPPRVEELRPDWLASGLFVVRALPKGHLPLGFGVAPPFVNGPLPLSAAVHPIV